MDIRLDYISEIDQSYIDKMTYYRKHFVELDKMLQELNSDERKNKKSERVVEIARSQIESALHYTIKALCILGEKKGDKKCEN